jgi:hypothetical protein
VEGPPTLRVQIEANPVAASAHLISGVEPQQRYGDAPGIGQAHDFTCVRFVSEVFGPGISARVIERGDPSRGFVPSFRTVGLVQIAGLAGQSRILEGVAASGGARRDMVDLEAEVEHLFGRPTVFASMEGTRCGCRLETVHRFTTGIDCVRLIVASNDDSMRDSSSRRSSGESAARRFFNSCRRRCCAEEKYASPTLHGQMTIGVDTSPATRAKRAFSAACGVGPNSCSSPAVAR